MKHTTYIAGALFALALAAPLYAAENDDLLNAVTATPDIVVAEEEYTIDDSVELSLDEEIQKMVGRGTGDTHKSEVAKAVADLLDTATLDGVVGEEVRALATEQRAIHERVAEKMEALEGRDTWQTFFWGPDYKSLGALRSELVTSENGLAALRKAQERAHVTLKDDIALQVTALEHEIEHARVFITEHEDVFSLFGWLVRLF